MSVNFYTGIGSRETPEEVLLEMTALARVLRQRGFWLRSGHADGADLAFEAGAGEECDIFLPWKGFNGSTSPLYLEALFRHDQRLFGRLDRLARRLHPAWHRCSPAARKLHLRNPLQLLGQRLDSPSEFVVCWTKNAKPVGGTGQNLRLCEELGMKVYNLASQQQRLSLRADFSLDGLLG